MAFTLGDDGKPLGDLEHRGVCLTQLALAYILRTDFYGVKVQGNQLGTTEVLALERGDNSGRGEKWLAFRYIFENWMWRGERGEEEKRWVGVRGEGEGGNERGIQKYSKPFGMHLAEMMQKPRTRRVSSQAGPEGEGRVPCWTCNS